MPLTSEAWDNFKIRQGTREPGAFRLGNGLAAAVLTGIIPSADLDTILEEGMETADADNATGQLFRTLPVTHPKRANLFLRTLDNCVGVSFSEKVAADPDGYLETPVVPYYADYTEYEATMTFESRPYPLLSDDTVESYTLTYYPTTDTGSAAGGTASTKTCYREEWRYTSWFSQAASEFIACDKGQFVYSVTGGGGGSHPSDLSSAGQGISRLLVPHTTWKCTWYAVPAEYLFSSNSYFSRLVGMVNQQDWEGFPAGHLRLEAVNTLRIYEKPFPGTYETYTGQNAVSQAKLCDLEFVFLEANRNATVSVTPTNRSHIASGHNVVPWHSNRKYYYQESGRVAGSSPGSGTPLYDSQPFQLLFQNPDGP